MREIDIFASAIKVEIAGLPNNFEAREAVNPSRLLVKHLLCDTVVVDASVGASTDGILMAAVGHLVYCKFH
ncbi:MAG: hypothetical protein AAB838_03470 [Patescibacteria group bacterium]